MTTRPAAIRQSTTEPPGTSRSALDARIRAITDRNAATAPTNIGFPAARDIDYRPLTPLLADLLNNIGDPWKSPLYPGHTFDMEREVLTFLAQLFRAPPGWGGYVTSGGTEGNLYALRQARTRLPNATVLYSSAAHYSVAKACDLLRMRAIPVSASFTGEIDYADLAHQASRLRSRPAVVVANVGSTMTEAIDDVSAIHAALDTARITHRYVHSDAALAGIPLVSAIGRPGFDLADGADSISISGHKFLGTPLVCGVVITRRNDDDLAPHVDYIDNRDTTINGSRNGLAAAMLWYAIQSLGAVGLAQRAENARTVARYAVRQLKTAGWPAWRNPHAMTVMLGRLPTHVSARWPLPTDGDWSHIVCMPGVTTTQVDDLVHDLSAHRHITT
jgi:histidine decarboxylase